MLSYEIYNLVIVKNSILTFYCITMKLFTYSVFSSLILLLASPATAQLAEGESKFLGNILQGFANKGMEEDTTFLTYWNQATPENAGKHIVLEGNRDVYTWETLDEIYAYCQANDIPFKQHTFMFWCCGSSAGIDWLENLPEAEIRAELEEFIRDFFNRYPNTAYAEVVNEPFQSPPSSKIRNALGGNTDYAWIRWFYTKARQYAPATCQLWINENQVLKNNSRANDYRKLVEALKTDGNLDAVGMQGHWLEGVPASTIKQKLDYMAEAGLPLYITEYEVALSNDQQQRNVWAEQFPVMWEHPAVQGVTLWGYREGKMWRGQGYLLRSNGSERPSLQWLKSYFDDGGSNTTFTPDPNTWYYVESRCGKRLDEDNDETVDLGDGTSYDKQWKFVSTSNNYYYLVGRDSNKKLDTNGDGITVDVADGTGVDKEWKIESAGNGYYHLESRRYSNKRLDADNCNSVDLSTEQGFNKQWSFVIANTNSRMEIVSAKGNNQTETEALQTTLQIYPNPVTDQLFVELPTSDQSASIVLRNTIGKLVLERAFTRSSYLDVKALPRGLYIAQIRQGVMVNNFRLLLE